MASKRSVQRPVGKVENALRALELEAVKNTGFCGSLEKLAIRLDKDLNNSDELPLMSIDHSRSGALTLQFNGQALVLLPSGKWFYEDTSGG